MAVKQSRKYAAARSGCVVLLSAAVFIASPTKAEPPELQPPVECEVGRECFGQNYVDHRPGDGYADFTCGPLSYDRHKGTDIRVPTLVEMQEGVPVVAAAPGVVKALRDGMPDVFYDQMDTSVLEGREAGNGVLIDHGHGWVTQYSHLRRGSVSVERGQRVEAGERLGLVGLSGRTEFPHVEFSVRHDGEPVDPYTGSAVENGCGEPGDPLWSEQARNAMAYEPGGLLASGFSTQPLTTRDIVADRVPRPQTTTADALVFWVLVYGARAGDRERLRLVGPDGNVVAKQRGKVPENKAQWLRYIGKRNQAWPRGRYVGHYTLVRPTADGTVTIAETRETLLLK